MANPLTIPALSKERMCSTITKQSCHMRSIKLSPADNISSLGNTVKLSGKRKAITGDSAGPLKKRAIKNGQYMEKSYPSTTTTRRCEGSHLENLNNLLNINLVAPSIAWLCKPNSSFINSSQAWHSQGKILNMYKPFNLCLHPFQSNQQGMMHKIFCKQNQVHLPQHAKTFGPFASSVQNHMNNLALNNIPQNDIKSNPVSMAFENKPPNMSKVLASTQDKDHLSEIQCLIRENVEIFTATEQDASSYFR